MSKLPKHPALVHRKYICDRRRIYPNLYSEENKKQQEIIIDKFEKSLKHYNSLISDSHIGGESILFHSMGEFAHPIFIQYLKEKSTEIIKGIPNFEYEIKQLLEFLYIKIHYKMIKNATVYGMTMKDYEEILEEYSKIFNVKYEKITYD